MSTRLELRPVSTVLELYLAELADRAGLPRPGILSPEHCSWAAARATAHANLRSRPEQPGPPFESRV